jgi:hypothetical protein
MYIARRGFVWWAVLPQSEVHDDAKTLKLMRDQLVKVDGEGKEILLHM